MIKVMFICHGNICRSTLSESLFTNLVKEKGLENKFEIKSSGTSSEEVGNSIHRGTINVLKLNGIPIVPHNAIQITKKDGNYYDYLICMDSYNIRNIKKIIDKDDYYKVRLLLDRDISDPWYTGDFDKTYEDILLGCTDLLDTLLNSIDLYDL